MHDPIFRVDFAVGEVKRNRDGSYLLWTVGFSPRLSSGSNPEPTTKLLALNGRQKEPRNKAKLAPMVQW